MGSLTDPYGSSTEAHQASIRVHKAIPPVLPNEIEILFVVVLQILNDETSIEEEY